MKKKLNTYKRIVCIVFVLALANVSCITTPICLTASNAPLQNKVISKNLGPVKGESSPWAFNGLSILNLWMIGKPDIDDAIKDALSKKGGDALINVRCYEKTSYFLLFSATKVIVEGEAIEFQ